MNGLVSTWLSIVLAAAPAPSRSADVELPENLVVSGAVSLGAYQAGFLYYFMRWRMQDAAADEQPLRVVSGASAGSLNGLVAALTACSAPNKQAPEAGIFWGWISVGMQGTDGLAAGDTTARSFLSRQPVDKALDAIGEYLDTNTAWRDCDVSFGATVTHLEGRNIPRPVDDSDSTRTLARVQADRFMFRIRSRDGAKPTIETYASPPGTLRSYYPVLGNAPAPRTIEFEELKRVLMASSAVPLAFEPVELEYLVGTQRAGVTIWNAHEGKFIDGGAFDNAPLMLARRMSEWRHDVGARFLFVDPTTTTWDRPSADKNGEKNARKRARGEQLESGLLGTYDGFVGASLRASREAALVTPIEGERDLAAYRLDMPARSLAVMSAQLIDMLGFFERDFRIFDYYLGMATARRYLARQLPSRQADLIGFRDEVAKQSPRFACVDSFVDRIDERNGVDPLPVDPRSVAECRELERGSKPVVTGKNVGFMDPAVIERVRDHNLLSLLAVSQELRYYQSKHAPDAPGASRRELDHLLELLGKKKFQFVDLVSHTSGIWGRKLRTVDPSDARALIRDTLESRLAEMASKQPPKRRLAVRVATQTGLNLLAYRDPQYVIGLGMKRFSAELTGGVRLGQSRVRLDLQVRIGEILHIEAFRRDRPGIAGGYTAETSGVLRTSVAALRNPIVQLEASGGFGVWEVFGRNFGHVIARPGIELAATALLLQRVYVEVAEQVFLDGCDRTRGTDQMHRWCAKLSPEITRNFKLHRVVVAAGLRFLPSTQRERRRP